MTLRVGAGSPRRSRRAHGDGGAALVEFAIIAPLLFALILGLFSGGIALGHKNSMTSAVREGARFGATLDHDADWADKVIARVVALAPTDLDANQVCVKLVNAPNTDVEASACADPELADAEPGVESVPNDDCAVLVWAQRKDKLEVVFFSRPLTLNAASISDYERDCS